MFYDANMAAAETKSEAGEREFLKKSCGEKSPWVRPIHRLECRPEWTSRAAEPREVREILENEVGPWLEA